MFCPECGKENPADAKICQSCGKPLKAEPLKPNSSNKKFSGKLVGLVAAAIILIAAVFMFISNSANTINLNKYLLFEEDGVNGYGSVDISFDVDRFIEENGQKFKLSSEGKKQLSKDMGFDVKELAEYLDMYSGDYMAESFIRYVDIDYDHSYMYSNGDTVEYSIGLDNEHTLEYLNCKIKFGNGTYKFKNLEDVKTVDGFEGVTLRCEGMSPEHGSVWVNPDSRPENISRLSYYAVKDNGTYSNGDVVTIEISDESIMENARVNGCVPESKTKDFTITGIPERLLNLSELSDAAVEHMLSESEDYLVAYLSKDLSDTEELISYEHSGTWALVPKVSYGYESVIYFTFDVTVHMDNGEDSIFPINTNGTFTYYVAFYNTMKDSSNEFGYECTDIRPAEMYGEYHVEFCPESDPHCTFSGFGYAGCKDLDAFIKERLNTNADKYTIEGGPNA